VIWHRLKSDDHERECAVPPRLLFAIRNPENEKSLVFEMSVSIQSFFTPDELALELEWLEARDMLLGENRVRQNVKRALELAAASENPKCQWLTDLFAGRTLGSVKDVCDVFLVDEEKSAASLCSLNLSMSSSCVDPLVWGTHSRKQRLPAGRGEKKDCGSQNLLPLKGSVGAFICSEIAMSSERM
jgi:hypothetical protein